MASVAADTNAIAPPLPLPSRSDAAPPAGPSGAFADILDASSASTPQGAGSAAAPTARPDEGSKPPPASKAGNGKDRSDGKAAKDNDNSAAAATANGGNGPDPTGVAGVVIAPLPLDLTPVAAGQSPVGLSDAQSRSVDPVAPTNDAPTGKTNETPVMAGLAAIAPTISAAAAPPSSTVTGITRDGSPVSAAISAATPLPNASEPAAGLDSVLTSTTASQQSKGPALPNAPVAAATQDLPDPLATPAADLQNVSMAALPTASSLSGTPDQNTTSNAAVAVGTASAASASSISMLASVAPPNPLLAGTKTASLLAPSEQSPANTGPAHESDPAQIALPAEVAAKFVASVRASGDGTSDLSPDAWLRSATSSGDSTRSGNGEPGTIQPTFNPAVLAPAQATASVAAPPQHAAVTADAVPLAGVPIAIAARAEAGEKHFDIRLDPPDLGRIEVTLSVDSNGRASSHLVVDRADTLDLLRRDAPALERALQSAGLTTDQGSLQFSLRDQSFAGRDQGAPAPLPPPAPAAVEGDAAPLDAAMRRYGAPAGLGGGIDIRV